MLHGILKINEMILKEKKLKKHLKTKQKSNATIVYYVIYTMPGPKSGIIQKLQKDFFICVQKF